MGYTRRRAVLCEIERMCAAVLSAYWDCAQALGDRDARAFRRFLEVLSAAAEQLERLVWAGDTAEWLGVSANSVLHRTGGRPSAGPLEGIPLSYCAWFLDSEELPGLLAAVAELRQLTDRRLQSLRQVV